MSRASGITLLPAVALLLALPAAHADSPYSQFQSGVPLSDIRCANSLILLESPRGTPACVKESSVEALEQRGFVPHMAERFADKPQNPVMVDNPTTEPVILDVPSGNNEFAVDFYKQVSDGDNIFFSPISMYVAFSVLNEGAGGGTAEQIQQVFRLEPDPEMRRAAVSGFMSHINEEDPNHILEMANALWLADWFDVYDSYVEPVREFYDADVETLDLPTVGKERIDDWAAEKTQGIIDDVLPQESLTDNTVLVITNAIYFLGNWTHQFPEEDTKARDFWKSGEESIRADFMTQEELFDYTSSNGAQVIKIPYKGDRLSMMIILPDERNGIENLEESLTADMIDEWNKDLASEYVRILLPKFTMETNYNLKGPLMNLGMTDVFSPGGADLLGLGDSKGDNMYVSDAIHKAFVDVDEKGTEAAAVTAIAVLADSVGPTSLPFIADHPFIFTIQDNETGAILFMGKLSEPPEPSGS